MTRNAWGVGLRPAAGLLLSALLGLAGCGGPSTGVVSGHITFKGEPVSFGTVAFIGQDGHTDSGQLQPDGGYTVARAPAVITVQTYPIPPMMRPPDKADAAPVRTPAGAIRYVPIPPRYSDDKTSDLRYTVKPGPQTFDVELKP
jgi:hypothetical protein